MSSSPFESGILGQLPLGAAFFQAASRGLRRLDTQAPHAFPLRASLISCWFALSCFGQRSLAFGTRPKPMIGLPAVKSVRRVMLARRSSRTCSFCCRKLYRSPGGCPFPYCDLPIQLRTFHLSHHFIHTHTSFPSLPFSVLHHNQKHLFNGTKGCIQAFNPEVVGSL